MRKYLCLMAALLLLASVSAFAQQLTAEQKAWVGKAEKYEKEGWIFLHIEIGRAHV